MASHPEQTYRWVLELKSPPTALWPLVSNTDRFNRDCGYPAVKVVPPEPGETPRPANTRRLSTRAGGMAIAWDELAFEWVEARRFRVRRTYFAGPLSSMVVSCELAARGAGTTLTYELKIIPANWLGRLALPYVIGKQTRATTERVMRRYDDFAQEGLRASQFARKPALAPGGADRLERLQQGLVKEAGQPLLLVGQLAAFVAGADDLSAAHVRPYALADAWNASRRDVLQLCLHATRAGLLDFSWDLICPHCRGAAAERSTLGGITSEAHCSTCQIDFVANFDQSVELTFKPNAAVRPLVRVEYCVGGPQVTPHIVAQQAIASGARHVLALELAPGRYRVRSPGLAQQQAFRVELEGTRNVRVDLGEILPVEPVLTTPGELSLSNPLATEQLAIIESVAWSNQSVTAAEVTAMQLFRDLFSREVLRPGEKISVGTMTVVFTDLKGSTQLYRTIGDAPAFGRVLTHFEILKSAVAAEDGAIVKTMGDAIMAVFPHPAAALRAMLSAQEWLTRPQEFAFPAGITIPPSSLQPLLLKAGIHRGPCLAINQNDRLDYFGTTVNVAARLCAACTGQDIVLSDAVCDDPEVVIHFANSVGQLAVRAEDTTLRGLGEETFTITRVTRA